MKSSVVAFSRALPQRCDIAVTEVDAVQPSSVSLPGVGDSSHSVVTLESVVLNASSLLVSNVRARASGYYGKPGVHSPGYLKLVGGSSLYVRYCSFEDYTHLLYAYSLSLSDHSVLAVLNNTMSAGMSFLFQLSGYSVSDHSVLRVVGNRGPVSYAIFMYNSWSVQQSSWLDWRDNDVGAGEMFYHLASAPISVDNSSAVTLTGCKMGSTGVSRSLLKHADAGYKFTAGCLTVAGKVLTAAEMGRNGIDKVTTVAACGECTKDGDCFGALTTAVRGCKCECASGGHGDVCAPAPVPVGPVPVPSPPSPPPPPAFGECVSDVVYPEVTQAVGSGLSWLCYRNVTFSGGA
ncbi:dispersed gene family protein 1 (DGF-1) [Trypanosoma conorhini]|uniref:Dispersed gene family protein 1 (DGF-1) n=1 Tax=Trypanosoma conorhini TaxID=83891 RepID=A0A422MY25_9TRYP|nr:dispersed gene family protein 1 (DGF-1) [Trypanosoma conorhini]RNE98116.1 dispersed gene family protein 1 (DGF-1) [Trypanosoma conorhini]